VIAMRRRRHKRSGYEIVSEVVGTVTLGAFAVLVVKALPELKRYVHLKRL
jgi:hypothetical protein